VKARDRRRAAIGVSASVLACAATAAAACGGGDVAGPAGPSPPTLDDAGDAGLPAPRWGLEARPANATCLAPPRDSSAAAIKIELLNDLRFDRPTELVRAPSGNTFYLLEQPGRVLAFQATSTASVVALDLSATVLLDGESGLLGLAFHPSFATKRHAYLYYTIPPIAAPPPAQRAIVSRFDVRPDGMLDPATESIILAVDQPSDLHKGGKVAFGPDGYLYVSFGEGATEPNVAQDPTSLLGKMLRIDVDSASPYGIPPTNPFASGGGRPEIYAMGFRNPWRFSFDRASGALWLGDVGQAAWEEIDVVELGGNYGWPIREGAHCFDGQPCDKGSFIDPVVEHATPAHSAIIGGVVYHGKAIGALAGKYVYGAFGGQIYVLEHDATTGAAKPVLLNPDDTNYYPSAIVDGPDDELYIAEWAQGAVFAIRPAAPGKPTPLPDRLSKTGCVDPADPKKPAPGLVPYAVKSELWSDGADKERWLAIPDGTKIGVMDDGDLDLPPRSVLMKTFSVGGRRVETRLFVRHDDGGWAGLSYGWDDAQTDAVLADGARTQKLPAGASWYQPSRPECLRCHTRAAGGTLGLEIAQLDRDFRYPNGVTGSQLANLEHIEIFDRAPPPVPRLSDGRDDARSYLHANCSFCHRPSTGIGSFDLRVTSSLEGACNAAPRAGTFGLPDAGIIVPGAPGRSVLSARMHRLGAGRMPPLASQVVDTAGAALVDAWITNAACR
jgi:uncharacterized repeat protein (TIGR03806 family)